jgi:hypothetical protein
MRGAVARRIGGGERTACSTTLDRLAVSLAKLAALIEAGSQTTDRHGSAPVSADLR